MRSMARSRRAPSVASSGPAHRGDGRQIARGGAHARDGAGVAQGVDERAAGDEGGRGLIGDAAQLAAIGGEPAQRRQELVAGVEQLVERGAILAQQSEGAAHALFGSREELVDLGRVDTDEELAAAHRRAGRRVVRGRTDLEVGLAEHRRRGHEDLAVDPQLGGPGAGHEHRQLDVAAAAPPARAARVAHAHRAAHLADVASGEPYLVAAAQRARRRHRHAHRHAGSERAIGQHHHPHDRRRQRHDERDAGRAPRATPRVVERRPQRH